MPKMSKRRAEELLADARAQLLDARAIRSAAWEESVLKRIDSIKGILYDIEHPPLGQRPRLHQPRPNGDT